MPSSSTPPSRDTPGASRSWRLALAGSGLLVVAGLLAFYYASRTARRAPADDAHAVTVTILDGGVCDPAEITVPAGRTRFSIVNRSTRALEWEILDGVMVVDERENIAPGITQTLAVKLRPGEFAITCGLLSSPRGRLVVTPSAASAAEAARPPLVEYVGMLAEYRVYLVTTAGELERAVRALGEAVAAGDRERARTLYAPAHQAYLRLSPIAELFADLDTRINARPEYFELRERDPRYAGFHRIAGVLFGADELPQVAVDALAADVAELRTRLRSLDIPPERLAAAAARALRRTADNLPAAGEDRGNPAERAGLQGVRDGAGRIAELLGPLLAQAAPALHERLQRQFAELDRALGAPPAGGAAAAAEPLQDAQRQTLAQAFRAAADSLEQVNAALGLE